MTIYFADSRIGESGDGLTWNTAFAFLEEALGAAQEDGDEIWCKWCVFNRNCGYNILKSGVSLYGGFPRHLQQTNGNKYFRPYRTVIDGGGAYRGLIMRTGSLIDRFEIRNCTADYGAGILIYTPT